jgi:hypothetical protein
MRIVVGALAGFGEFLVGRAQQALAAQGMGAHAVCAGALLGDQ